MIAAKAVSIPETVAGAAFEVPVGDSSALEKALDSLAVEGELARELKEKGRARVAALDWDVTARALLDLLERAAGKAP